MMYMKKTPAMRRLMALALVPAIGAGIAVTALPSFANGTSYDKTAQTAAEQPAEFPGGLPAMIEWLRNNIKYPEKAQNENVEGLVVVRFTVKADGTVTNAEVAKGVSPELDAEALRVVGNMPKWIPGKANGKAAECGMTLPVSFKLTEDKKSDTAR